MMLCLNILHFHCSKIVTENIDKWDVFLFYSILYFFNLTICGLNLQYYSNL
jgi:hypothetical protein